MPTAMRDNEPVLRQGRRLRWIEGTLAPLRESLDGAEFARLVHGLSTLIGVESYVVLHDGCGLDREAVLATLRWAGRTLIESASATGARGR
jgi:hypothetical protein